MREIRRLFAYTQGLRKYMIFVAVAGIIGAALEMIGPFIIKFATDEVTAIIAGKSVQPGFFIMLLGVLALSYVVAQIVSSIAGYMGDMLSERLQQQLSQAYYRQLLRLPQTYYDNENTGKIISRLDRAIADVARFVQVFSNFLLQTMLMIVSSLLIIAWYSWEIALVVLLQVPLYIYLTMKTSEKWQLMEFEKNDHLDIARGRFAEAVGNMRLIKSFGAERREAMFFETHTNKTITIASRQSRYWHKMDFYREMIRVVVYVVMYGLLFWRAAQGQISIGDLVLLVTLVQRTSQPLQNMSFFVDQYQRAIANSKDYAKVMQEDIEPQRTGGVRLQAKQATVRYEGVSFGYEDKEVVKRISFTIKPGEKLALVSRSGGGKTTLSNLLMRLYAPKSGTIYINDTPIDTVSARSLRAMIATVFQDAALFSGTIRENIAYAKPRATNEEIERAARAANALDFIRELEHGFDTEIGERGVKLSGGQRQRIAIARAILKDAPILILDEATSALDSQAEHEVQIALNRLMKGRTTLIIAHRLSTIADVDTIVTLKRGTIDEIGTPAQLAKTNGIYAQLLALQSGSSKAAKKKLEQFDIAA